MVIIRIEQLTSGESTEFDGQYVVDYNPARIGVSPSGLRMICYLKCTPDKTQARQFASLREAVEFYRKSYGLRPDGQPNRPLTAYTVTFES
jgi:hypothetical protein